MLIYRMERQLSVGTIDRKLDHLKQTKDFLKRENLDVTDIERQIRELEKMRSKKSKGQPKKLSMETINRRLKEKRATVQMLRQMGTNPSVVEKEIIELNKQKSMIESSGLASGKFPIKILCFDLDETILTSTDPSVRAGNL